MKKKKPWAKAFVDRVKGRQVLTNVKELLRTSHTCLFSFRRAVRLRQPKVQLLSNQLWGTKRKKPGILKKLSRQEFPTVSRLLLKTMPTNGIQLLYGNRR